MSQNSQWALLSAAVSLEHGMPVDLILDRAAKMEAWLESRDLPGLPDLSEEVEVGESRATT